ncbi:MAG: hypothetical protein JNG83_01955 [Opitutaceae bacterium]|nr:hypothetical protein [Opitutaceae bacterium]
MIDAIKKTLLAGVGAAVITKDKVEAALGDFVAQGKVSTTEARAMAEKIARDGRQEFENVSAELGARVNDLVARSAGEAQARLQSLEARLRELEARSKARARPAAKAARRARPKKRKA